MRSRIKNLFFIPTSALVFLALASGGALLVDIYILFTLDSYSSITIEGIEHLKGSREFFEALQGMKRSVLFSALLALIVGFFTSRTIYKRKSKLPE